MIIHKNYVNKSLILISLGKIINKNRDEKGYIYFNELLYRVVKPIYGKGFVHNKPFTDAEDKFRKQILTDAEHQAKRFYKVSNVNIIIIIEKI